jgi:hypothetical protein
MEYHIMVFQTLCKHFALPVIWRICFLWLEIRNTVGASLLAKAVDHPTSPATEPLLSRAGSLPHWICGGLALFGERNALDYFEVIASQARIFQRRPKMPQLTHPQILQNLRPSPDL